MPKFQYYPSNVKITKPLGIVSLYQFLEANKNPKDEIKKVFNQIRIVSEEEKRELKSKLFYFSPCVQTDGIGRSYSNITSFTGLLCLEFDKIPDFAVELRDWIFDNFEECVCAYISPSGIGTKSLWKIPRVKTVDEYKEYFNGLAYKFSKIEGFDPSSQNPILPLYLSWDENLRSRPFDEAKTWTQRGLKLNSIKPIPIDFRPIEDVSNKDLVTIYKRIDSTFGKIERDQSGHVLIRGLSLWLGGICAYGYMTTEEAIERLCEKVAASNYCEKNISGYCKTIKDYVIRGSNSPIKLEENAN